MTMQSERLVRLYLPLLTSPEPAVRRQAGLVLRCSYGARARTYIQPLLRDNDLAVRNQVRLALDTIALLDGELAPGDDHGFSYVQCLGRLQAHIGASILALDNWERSGAAKVGWQKVRRVFAYLLHCGKRGAARPALMEAVWGGEVTSSTLSRTLATLHHTLVQVAGAEGAQALITIADDHCALNPDVYQSDAEQFQNAYELGTHTEDTRGLDAAAPLYLQALDLYGGPYLIDIGPADWALDRRELLASYFTNCCERLAEQAFAAGRHRRCVELCQYALDADLAADDVTVWLLRAYAALGRYPELERAYAVYLRATRLDLHSPEAHDDLVVAEYGNLISERSVGSK